MRSDRCYQILKVTVTFFPHILMAEHFLDSFERIKDLEGLVSSSPLKKVYRKKDR